MKWILLLLLLAVVIFGLGMRFGRVIGGGRTESVAFVPVSDLPAQTQSAINDALAQRKQILAVKIYRDATGAGLAAAKTAVDVHARRDRGA